MSPASRLFTPLKVGSLTLKHRIAMAPLTRFRASDSHVPLPMVTTYYAQRASVPGTLLVTEGTIIDQPYGGYPNVPGIYTPDQIAAWRNITTAVHEKGSHIFLQLWALGRTANPEFSAKNGIPIKSSSAVALDNGPVPEAYTQQDIDDAISAYVRAAQNAISAGFDGVEIHAANGYLIDQFIQDTVNQRTDSYGGSIENRSRFAIAVATAVSNAIGSTRTGIRLSPFSEFQGMRMQDPYPQFTHLITHLNTLNLAYLHLVTSRVSGNADLPSGPSLLPLAKLFTNPVLLAGGYTPESALELVDAADSEFAGKDVVVVFGRYFISTPDIVFRIREGIKLNEYDRGTFYTPGQERGYVDQGFSEEFLARGEGVKAAA